MASSKILGSMGFEPTTTHQAQALSQMPNTNAPHMYYLLNMNVFKLFKVVMFNMGAKRRGLGAKPQPMVIYAYHDQNLGQRISGSMEPAHPRFHMGAPHILVP
jgi:hypothetical protein